MSAISLDFKTNYPDPEDQECIKFKISFAVFYGLLFLLGTFNLYGYMYRIEKWRDLAMCMLYFNAQMTLICLIIQTIINPSVILYSRAAFILPWIAYYCSLAMGICYCMVIFELWFRMRYAMEEIHQVEHKQKLSRTVFIVSVLTIILNLVIYFMCGIFTYNQYQYRNDSYDLEQILTKQAWFISSVEILLCLFSVACVVLILKMLRSAFGTFFKSEMRRLVLLAIVFFLSFLFRMIFDIFFSIDLSKMNDIYTANIIGMSCEFTWIFFPILVIYYQHTNGYVAALRLANNKRTSQMYRQNNDQRATSVSQYRESFMTSSILDQSDKASVNPDIFEEVLYGKQLGSDRASQTDTLQLIMKVQQDNQSNSDAQSIIIKPQNGLQVQVSRVQHQLESQKANRSKKIATTTEDSEDFSDDGAFIQASMDINSDKKIKLVSQSQMNSIAQQRRNILIDNQSNSDQVRQDLYKSCNNYSLNSSDYQKFRDDQQPEK